MNLCGVELEHSVGSPVSACCNFIKPINPCCRYMTLKKQTQQQLDPSSAPPREPHMGMCTFIMHVKLVEVSEISLFVQVLCVVCVKSSNNKQMSMSLHHAALLSLLFSSSSSSFFSSCLPFFANVCTPVALSQMASPTHDMSFDP